MDRALRHLRRSPVFRVLWTFALLGSAVGIALLPLAGALGWFMEQSRSGHWPWVWGVVGCAWAVNAWNLGFLLWLMLRAGGWLATGLLGAEPARDRAFLDQVNRIFVAEAGMPRAPRVYWLRSRQRNGPVNALLLCDRLLVSRALAIRLGADELEAVLRHEAAHARLGHLGERASLALGVVSGLFLPWAGLGRLAGVQVPALLGWPLFYLTAAWAMRSLIRRHELEADAWAAARSSDPLALGRALRAVTRWNRQDPERAPRASWLLPMAGHPPCEDRVRRLVASSAEPFALSPPAGGGSSPLGPAPRPVVRFRARAWLSPRLVCAVLLGLQAAAAPGLAWQAVGPSLAVQSAQNDDLAALARLEREGVDLNRRDWLTTGLTPREAAARRGSAFTQQWLEISRHGRSAESRRMPAGEAR